MRRRVVPLLVAPLVLLALGLGLLAACADDDAQGSNVDPEQVDTVAPPQNGACRVLAPDDIAQPSNATRTVDCAEHHTAQTYAVGELPPAFDDADREDPELGAFAYETCSREFLAFLQADESRVMRSMLNWAWFRPSEEAWEKGARWYRCDVVGGSEESEELIPLPPDARGLLEGMPEDKWMACVAARTVVGQPRVPCSEKHTWRAVTTIKVGEPGDPYPGDRVVEVTTRDFCSKSVGAWLGYPDDYDFAYTWFHEAEWEAGNRRSVCWAKTPR